MDTLNLITEPARRVPVLARPDVLVVGGGAAGLAAAAAAAREGAETLLIERHAFLGGTLTAVSLGGLCGMYREVDGALRPVVGGLWCELESRLRSADALGAPRRSSIVRGVHGVPYDPERLKRVADEWMASAGVRVLTGALLAGVRCEASRIDAVFVETVAGRRAILPRVVIDASGDAEVIAHAGGPVSIGAEGALQSPSAMFRMTPVDRTEFASMSRAELADALSAWSDRETPLPRTTIAVFPYLARDEVHVNATRVRQLDGAHFDTTDPWARAAAEVEGRRQAFDYERALRAVAPGFDAARITAIGAALGVREGRRIHGDTELTETDVMQCRASADRIACCAWPIEDHARDRATHWQPLPAGGWYGIPFGALVPRGLTNALVAGRCLSATHAAQASARISAACIAMGEAAGLAGALALTRDDEVRVEVSELQARLRAREVILDPL